MNAVITPTGKNVGAMITLDIKSAIISNTAPKAADAGIRYLLSEPMKIRTIWGATNPMKPIMPVKQTTDADIRDMTINKSILSL